jgi:hypothetical protein
MSAQISKVLFSSGRISGVWRQFRSALKKLQRDSDKTTKVFDSKHIFMLQGKGKS